MKKYVSFIMISILLAALIIPLLSIGIQANAGTSDAWEAIGSAITEFSGSSSPKFAVDNGTPYVAVPVGTTSIVVYKFNGSSWEQMCSQTVPFINFGFDVKDGVPYLAVPGTSATTIIKKYDGSAWEQLGTTLSTYTSEKLLAIAPDGTVYYNGRNLDTGALYYYTGSTWRQKRTYKLSSREYKAIDMQACEDGVYVGYTHTGVSSFAIYRLPYDTTNHTSEILQLDEPMMYVENGVIYVVHRDTSTFKITVSYIESSNSKVDIGPSKFAPENYTLLPGSYSVAALDGTPYTAYVENNANVAVKKYDASTNTWVNAGSNVSSLSKGSKTDMISDNGRIYLMISDPYNKHTIQLYKMQVSADKSGLNQVIAEAEALDSEIYTPLSWAQLQTVLTEARNLAADTAATQGQIDAAGTALRDSIRALVRKGDKSSLIEILERASYLQREDYVLASWNKLVSAVSYGEYVMNNENASQSDVNSAVYTIRDALKKLQPAVKKEALGMTIRSCLALTESEYSAESWAALQVKLSAAINIYNALPGDTFGDGTSTLTSASQTDVDNANSELLTAMSALQGSPRLILLAIIAQATELDSSGFEPQSWKKFSVALSNAQAAVNDPNANDEELQAHLEALSNAMNNLRGAEELPEYPDVYTIDVEGHDSYIYGTVDASIISAEVTLSTYFHINPNAADGERFISPDLSITNTSTMPIYVHAVSMKATGDAPRVVADTKYTDAEWSQLNVTDTISSIALGLTGAPATPNFFFADESEQEAIPLDNGLVQGETDILKMQGKHGLSWLQPRIFRYDMTLVIGLVD